jgi:hypothetical protein
MFNKLQTINIQCNKFQIKRIYKLTCWRSNSSYISQIGWQVKIRFVEHQRHIKNNNPKSAYALHVLKKRHECGTIQNTVELLITCKNGYRMNCWETFYINTYQQGLLIQKQFTPDPVPLFMVIQDKVCNNASAARKTGLLPQTDLCLTGSDTRHITYIGLVHFSYNIHS